MLSLDIPGGEELRFEHLVLDFNGTLAVDGEVLPGVRERLILLQESMKITILTADTYGTVHERLQGYPCSVVVLSEVQYEDPQPVNEAEAKWRFLNEMHSDKCIYIGNGTNDIQALTAAGLGIAVLQPEGIYPKALWAARAAASSIHDALDLLLMPNRLIALLRP